MRRHKWKKAEHFEYTVESDELFSHYTHSDSHVAKQCKECIHCGLMKGTVRSLSWFPKLVFFRVRPNVNVALSIDRIPGGGCNPELGQIEREFVEAQTNGYFSPTDFMIE